MSAAPTADDRITVTGSARAAVAQFLAAMEDFDDPAVFIAVADAVALDELAATIDERPADEVPLRGLVFAVKDNIDVAGLPTTAGCPAFAYAPARSARVVELLVDAGAVPVGKTNLDQFATGLVGTRSPHGVPRNPHDPEHVPGGSSSGSAVAVARGLVDFALGTDTAGSGRVPAAFCGIVGIKPTFGIVSTRGSVPAVRSADCISIFTRDLDLGPAILDVVSSFDPDDAFARPTEPPTGPTGPAGIRLGVVSASALRALGADAETVERYEGLVDRIAALVAEIVEIDLGPFCEAGDLLYGGPWVAERTAAVGAFIDEHPGEVDPTVASIITAGWTHDAVAAHRAQYRLAELRRTAGRTFEVVDGFVVPTVPHGARLAEVAAEPVTVNSALGRFTTFANLLDLCALSVPAGVRSDDGMPFGVTFYGPAFEDPTLLRLAGGLGLGVAEPTAVAVPGTDTATLVVAGAHLRGQPLEHQLTDLGARFVATTRTAPTYRLYALVGTTPEKPGLVFDPTGGSIEVDVWEVTHDALGRFLRLVPPPLALGTVQLEDGTSSTGFVCEPRALDGALDITHLGGWRAHRARAAPG